MSFLRSIIIGTSEPGVRGKRQHNLNILPKITYLQVFEGPKTVHFDGSGLHENYKILPPKGKSTISFWKLITFYPNNKIWPNKLLKPKLSNHDNTQFVWVYLVV